LNFVRKKVAKKTKKIVFLGYVLTRRKINFFKKGELKK
tara:strand:+ start:1071 stop:1184 length:114 start_codon:yes stop_codon:yes gene_type:complete